MEVFSFGTCLEFRPKTKKNRDNFFQKMYDFKLKFLMKLPSLTERIYFHNSANDTHQSNYRYPDDFLKFKSPIESMKR